MRTLALAATVLTALASAGCTDDRCQSNADCPPGRMCHLGLCALDPSAAKDVPTGADGLGDVDLSCEPATADDLVMTEVLIDPAGVDVSGDGNADSQKNEFVEVVNVSGASVGLSSASLQIGSKTIPLGAFCLGPNQARVLFSSEASLGLTNAPKDPLTVSLLVNGATVQSLTYGGATPLKGDKKQSLTLTVQLDPLSAWDLHSVVGSGPWSPGKCANGNDFPNCTGAPVDPDAGDATGGDLPDTVAPCGPAPTAGQLIINELLADPGNMNDANQDGQVNANEDEFIEIVNVATEAIDLGGVTLSEAAGKTFTFPAGACLQPHQAALMFGKYEGGGDFGGAIAFGYGGQFALNNDTETVTLKAADGQMLDSVSYGAEGNADQSLTRETDLLVEAPFVKHMSAPRSGGSRMSPGRCQNGRPFPDCAAPPDTGDAGPTDGGGSEVVEDVGPACGAAAAAGLLVINEVLADPDGVDVNGDGTYSATHDEFVELVNVSGETLDLSGVKLLTGATDPPTDLVHTFAGLCLEPQQGVVLFGGGAPALSAEGAVMMTSNIGLSLNNGGDTVALVAADGQAIDTVTYGASKGVSLARQPDGSGDFAAHPTLPSEQAWSPGLCTTGTAFAFCLP